MKSELKSKVKSELISKDVRGKVCLCVCLFISYCCFLNVLRIEKGEKVMKLRK